MNYGFKNIVAQDIALAVNLHNTAHGQTVHVWLEAAHIVRKIKGEHRDYLVDGVNAGAALVGLQVNGALLSDIVADICDMNAQHIMPIFVHAQGDGIVKILGVVAVNGKDCLASQVNAVF